jgi:hypothetical protein
MGRLALKWNSMALSVGWVTVSVRVRVNYFADSGVKCVYHLYNRVFLERLGLTRLEARKHCICLC